MPSAMGDYPRLAGDGDLTLLRGELVSFDCGFDFPEAKSSADIASPINAAFPAIDVLSPYLALSCFFSFFFSFFF